MTPIRADRAVTRSKAAMTVDELIQAPQELNQPDLEVYVPCPHCCGQPGADFDMLDADHCLTMEREGRTVAVLGDPRHQSLQDRRMT